MIRVGVFAAVEFVVGNFTTNEPVTSKWTLLFDRNVCKHTFAKYENQS